MRMAKIKSKKNTHWLRTTLIVLIVCAVAGCALAMYLFNRNAEPVRASITLELTFEGATSGVAPNGNKYDLSLLTTDEVLNEAIAASGLSLSAEQLRDSITVTGTYPENMVSQAQSYDSLLDFTANRSMPEMNFHPTRFTVSLTDHFGFSKAELTGLLDNVLKSFRPRFTEELGYGSNLSDPVFNFDSYDYAQQVNILQEQNTLISAYAQSLYEEQPSFRSGGMAFNDIVVRLANLNSSDMTRLSADLTMNALTRNTARLITQYQYEIRDLSNQLTRQKEQLESIDALINSYEKNEIIYLSTSDSLSKIDGNSSETYDTLVARRKRVADSITDISSEIQVNQLKLSDLMKDTEDDTSVSAAADPEDLSTDLSDTESLLETVPEMTEEEIAAAAEAAEEASRRKIAALESGIASVRAKSEAVIEDLSSMIQSLNDYYLNEGTVSVYGLKYDAPSLISGSFVKQVIMTAGPFCALGLMVCLLCVFLSRRKEEKTKA